MTRILSRTTQHLRNQENRTHSQEKRNSLEFVPKLASRCWNLPFQSSVSLLTVVYVVRRGLSFLPPTPSLPVWLLSFPGSVYWKPPSLSHWSATHPRSVKHVSRFSIPSDWLACPHAPRGVAVQLLGMIWRLTQQVSPACSRMAWLLPLLCLPGVAHEGMLGNKMSKKSVASVNEATWGHQASLGGTYVMVQSLVSGGRSLAPSPWVLETSHDKVLPFSLERSFVRFISESLTFLMLPKWYILQTFIFLFLSWKQKYSAIQNAIFSIFNNARLTYSSNLPIDCFGFAMFTVIYENESFIYCFTVLNNLHCFLVLIALAELSDPQLERGAVSRHPRVVLISQAGLLHFSIRSGVG